ncbi:MAG: alpha/beta fold hydrolase [Simkania sp.]|nr:alpha/beta fold hydrolase [Simkania sp.]MCP5491151.1 alpha/beta fold hydrolase [Chlamydiales bacterium]
MITYIHGFLGGPEDWNPLIEQLSGPYQTLASPEEIEKPVTLVGYSMGGRLALDFATRHPKRVENLIILSANPGIDDPIKREARRLWDEEWCHLIKNQGFEAFLEKWYAQPLFTDLRKRSDFHEIFKRRMENDPDEVIATFRRLSPGVLPSCWKAIEKFLFPTLFLFGERDIKYHLIRNKLAKLGVKTDLISNSGHAIHLENPTECAHKIKEFLCQQASCKK